MARTDKQIFDQTNELARKFYDHMGNRVKRGYRFDLAEHPQEYTMWKMACTAQQLLTNTDPADIDPEEFYPEGRNK